MMDTSTIDLGAMKTAKGLEKTLINVLAQEMFKTVDMADMGHEAKQFKDLWIETIAEKAELGIAEKIIYPYLMRKINANEKVPESVPSQMLSPATFNHLLRSQVIA